MGSGNGRSDRVEKVENLITKLFPYQRMINSPGLDTSFSIIKQQYPAVKIHEYPSGSECEDWIVPESWQVISAFMEDENGHLIASYESEPLFVAPYSEPVDGWFSKDRIRSHLTTREDMPDAFILEHRYAYDFHLNDWGISLPFNIWRNLVEGSKYHIKIEVERNAGTMKCAEWYVQGKKDDTICICAHIDELCNDDLSGCAVGLELMKIIQERKDLQYSYQLLLSPELIGTIFFVGNNPDKIKNTLGMLNLESLGAGEKWHLKSAIKAGSLLENVLELSFTHCGIEFDRLGFFEGYGNDERVYAWPTLNIEGVGIQLYPFEQYHTSDDTPRIIEKEKISQGLKLCETLVDILEKNYTPVFVNMLPPWFTRRRLYFDRSKNPDAYKKFNNLAMFNLDGTNTLVDLCRIAQMDFYTLYQYLEIMVEDKLIEKRIPK